MSPLRFCMITTFYPPYAFGGDATYVHRLSNLLARRGHEVDVIHCVDSYRALTTAPPAAGFENERGVTVHGLRSAVGRLSPLATQQTGYPLFKSRAIRGALAAKAFDVIHFHNVSLIGGPMILRYGEAVKLYTLHEHWLVCPTHVLFKFQREPCVKPSCLRCVLIHRRPPQLWRYTRMLERALRHVDLFIAPSAFTRDRHRAAGLAIPTVQLPPFVEPPANDGGQGAETDVPGTPRPYFLFVGRLEKLKGLQTLIPVFRDYAHADLLIAGEGDYAAELRRLAGDNSRIHFLGRLSPAQLRGAYARAVALVVPSVTFEVFGQVIIEAFAVRTPVIVRDLGALPEIVAESGGGLVFRDTVSLVAAMARMQDDPALRHGLGQAGYAAYRTRWTEDAHLERYLDLVEQARAARAARKGPS